LETNILHKNVCEDLTFAVLNKTVDTSIVGGSRGKNLGFRDSFEVQATFLSVGVHQFHLVCRKGVLGFLQHLANFQANIVTRKFHLGIEISTKWPSSFQVLFLAITSQLHRLAAFPRSVFKASE